MSGEATPEVTTENERFDARIDNRQSTIDNGRQIHKKVFQKILCELTVDYRLFRLTKPCSVSQISC